TKYNPCRTLARAGKDYDRTDSNAKAEATASTQPAARSTTGIGISVALNLPFLTTEATIGRAHVTADGVIVDVDPGQHFSAQTTSGSSGMDTGVAGSLAINVGISNEHATIAPNATITISDNGDLKIVAENHVLNEAKANAHQGGTGKVGVGASIAVNIGVTETMAFISDEATVTGAHDVIISASSKNDMVTTASGGAAGKTAVTPVVAIAVAHNETVATLGKLTDDTTGDPQALVISGAYKAFASHEGTVKTVAEGDTKSGDTGVGISLALTIASDSAVATTGRDITAGGAATFTAP